MLSPLFKILGLISILLFVSCASGLKDNFRTIETRNNGFSGILVYNPENKQILLDHNSNKYFTPASNIKILTLFAGIQLLEDSIVGIRYSKRNDSLIFTSTGDPSLLNPKFSIPNPAIQFLKNSDKKLFYQKTNWDEKQYGPGWSWDDLDYSFSAQRSAFPIYGNLIKVHQSREQPMIIVQPDFFRDSIYFTNFSTFKRATGLNQFYLPQTLKKDLNRSFPFNTSEELSIKILEKELDKSISTINTRFLLDEKINSVAADSLYKTMMHQSDNFIAEQVLLMSSGKLKDTLNTKIVIDHIKQEKFNSFENEVYWVDGSGLSRYNLATPAQLVKTLHLIYLQKGKEYVEEIFPTAGKHGTLKNLLEMEEPFVYAKSGTLRNNYSLSGFLETKNGKFLIFSFMNSNFTTSNSDLKSQMEDFLLELRNKY